MISDPFLIAEQASQQYDVQSRAFLFQASYRSEVFTNYTSLKQDYEVIVFNHWYTKFGSIFISAGHSHNLSWDIFEFVSCVGVFP